MTDVQQMPTMVLCPSDTSDTESTLGAMMDENFFEGTEKLLEIWFSSSRRPGQVQHPPYGGHMRRALGSANTGPNGNNGGRNGHVPGHDSDHDQDDQDELEQDDDQSEDDVQQTAVDEESDDSLGEGEVKKEETEPDLRKIPRSAWESMLKLAKCTILSTKRNESVDAYVLSESSLFVFKERIIIKTCGSTRLLRCVEMLLYLAREWAGFDEVLDIYYSRKNFMRPELQPKPHSSFDDEIEALDTFFGDGAAYCLGRINSDHWYLYTLNPMAPSKRILVADQTLEVIMQDLDQDAMSIFTRECSSSAKEATIKSGIDKLLPNMVIDDFLFSPCGYSMNGLIKGGWYVTIHITPEPECSYVSFETNYPMSSYQELVDRLLKIFGPNKFLMTIFANEGSEAINNHRDFKSSAFPGFLRHEYQFCRLKNYDLTYAVFAKAPS